MKKLLLTLVILLFSISSYSQYNQMGKFSFAGNLSYGTKIESLGIGLRAQYGFLDRLRGALEYKYYIDRHNTSAWGIAADAHYLFGLSDAISLYPIGGLTISRWTTDFGRSGIAGIEGKESNNRLGLNLGFGTQIATGNNSFLQIEAKEALIKNYSQFVISVGFMFQF